VEVNQNFGHGQAICRITVCQKNCLSRFSQNVEIMRQKRAKRIAWERVIIYILH